MKSMTGYGRGEGSGESLKIVAEIKAVNHRYSEILIKQPRQYMVLEDNIKKLIGAQIKRGRIEVFIRTQMLAGSKQAVTIDRNQALTYHQGLKDVAEALNEPYKLDIYRLASLPGVIVEEEQEEDLKEIWPIMEQALTEAMAQHMAMREAEGERIRLDMLSKLAGMQTLVQEIGKRSPEVLTEYKEKLRNRVMELSEGIDVSEERLAQEVAYFTEKGCIDEELVRLASHFVQFEQIVNQQGDVGRKLDFLIQEMNRETNTIGSKANDLVTAQLVVDMKSELEKVREQVQNIE